MSFPSCGTASTIRSEWNQSPENNWSGGGKLALRSRYQMHHKLTRCRIDYFDLFLIHFPVALEYVDPEKKYPTEWEYYDGTVKQSKATIQQTWEAMEGIYKKGLAKNIGISNFQVYPLLCARQTRMLAEYT